MTERPISQPLHRQLRDLMMARIDAGEWPPGTYLPPEIQLAQDYGVAVGTLRKALLDLAAEGVVQRRQGKGTVVTSHDSDAALFRFFNMRTPDGNTMRPESRVLSRRQRRATAVEAAHLGISAGTDVICITRVREVEGVPILYEHILLDAARFGPLMQVPETLPNTLYQLYQSEFGATVHRAEEHLRAVASTRTAAAELGVAIGTPLLEITRRALDYNANPIELRVSLVCTQNLYYKTDV